MRCTLSLNSKSRTARSAIPTRVAGTRLSEGGRGPFSPPVSVAKVNSMAPETTKPRTEQKNNGGARPSWSLTSASCRNSEGSEGLASRRFWIRLFFLFVFGLLASGGHAQGILNGDFEQGLTDWSVRDDRGMSEARLEAARSGSLGLRITDEDTAKGSSAESLPAEALAGATYEVSFWARTISGSGEVQVAMRFFDEKRKSLQKKPRSITVKPAGEWEQFTIQSKAPEGSVAFVIWIHSLNADVVTMDLDDFTVREVEGPGE